MSQSDVDQWAAAGTQALQQTQAEQLRSSVSNALSINPDQEAQTRRLAAAAQVPLETARALPDTVRQQAQMSTFDAALLARKFPTTAQLIANPDLARITHDDIPATAQVEQAVRALPPAPAADPMPDPAMGPPAPTRSSTLWDALRYIVGAPDAQGQGNSLAGDLVGGFTRTLAGTGKYLALAGSTLDRPVDALFGTNLQQGALDAAARLDAFSKGGPGKEASFGRQLINAVGSTGGVLTEAMLTGGQSVPARTGASILEALGPHIAHGVQSMMVPSAVAAQDTYNSVLEQTGNVVDATKAALASYTTTSLGGVVPFATPGKLAWRLGSGMAMGPLLGDVSHEVMNAALPPGMQQPDRTWEDRGLDAVMGAMFGGMAGPHDVADIHQRITAAARQSYVDAIRTEADARAIEALHGLGQVSAVAKLRERDPEAFKQFVESVTEDGHLQEVYVDAKTLTNALNQSGVTEADLRATMPEVLEQLHEATVTNGDVRIPVADYATHLAGTDIDAAILPHLKTDPEGNTYTEAKEFYQNQVESLKGTVERMLAEKDGQAATQASRTAIRDQVLAQLNEVNRFRPDVNRLHAEVIADHRMTMAARLGMTPEQFSERYPLRFTSEGGVGDGYEQGGLPAGITEDEYIARINPEGKVREFSEPMPAAAFADMPTSGDAAGSFTTKSGKVVDLVKADGELQGALLAVVDGKVVGYMAPEAGTTGLFVADEMRGQGIGEALSTEYRTENPLAPSGGFSAAGEAIARKVYRKLAAKQQAAHGVDEATGLPLNADGTVTVYHHTTAERAAEILRTGRLKSAGEPDLYFTTTPETNTGYGDTAIPFRVKPSRLQLDDEFPDGRQDYRVAAPGLSRRVRVLPDGSNVLDQSSIETIYHGTTPAAARAIEKSGFDVKRSADGSIWFTSNPNVGEVAASGKGGVVKRTLDSSKLKLGGWEEADKFSTDQLIAQGYDGLKLEDNGETTYQIFNPEKLGKAVEQQLKQDARGRISFGDDITQQPSVISLLKDADLSTTIHELGHFFLEVNNHLTQQIEARIAAGETVTPGEQSIVDDMHTALSWMGVKSTPEMSATDHWASLSLDEKREFHENFARGFEAYMMEGKAPSVGLARAFQAFRSWLISVYKSLTALRVELTPEVRGVFDRMLASDEAIKEAETVRGYRPLFESAQDAGMTAEEFAQYQSLGKDATADATDELQGRSLRDMKWLAGAKSKAMKALQKEAESKRKEVQQQVTKEVMSQPIYRAWTFLTSRQADKVEGAAPVGNSKGLNPEKDNLFTAIAKLGGLNRDEVQKLWGIDAKEKLDSGVFGQPVVRKTGGLSTDAMAERLVEEGYLLPDEHGKADPAKFEELFDDQRRGTDRYSIKRDMAAAYGDAPLDIPDLPDVGYGRLRTQDLREMFGESENAVWRKLSQLRMTSDKGGLHPDIVAEMFGLDSGRDLVEQLANVEHPKQVIEGMTDQRMLEQHGDLVDPQAIERAAEAAIHNEARARFVATELKALTKATGPARAMSMAAKEAAEAAIAAKRVRDLRPGQYTAAEARAARAAQKALAAGDTQAAATEKRAQLLNNRLATAAADAIEEVRKGVQYLAKFDKPGVRANIDLEYRDQIDALLDRYDLRKSTSAKALDKREALLQFVDRMASQGYEPQIPEKLLDEATRMHFKDMPVEDFRGLVDAVKSIEHLGRLKTRLLDLKETRELQALADEATATTAELPQRTPESNRGLTRMQSKWLSVKSAGRSMQAALLKMEQMFDWLDNRNPNGVFNRVVFRRIADAGVREADMQAQVKAKIDALLHSHLADVTKDGGKIYVADGLIDGLTGKPQRFTKKEMLALAGNMGNESNTAKLIKGEKWQEAAVWDFLNKNMGKADWDFVAGLGRTLESLWPEKLAMSRRLGNTNPEKIQPRPFDTPHGRYEGWYWPMVYDPARAQDVAERGARAGDALFENIYTRANTDTGRMNTRSENYARPLLLSLDTIPRVIKDEIHDVAYREAIMDADKFLSHKDVRAAIQDALSPEHYDQLRPWLQSIANDRKVDMAALKWFDQLAHGARTRATIVGLGYRISTMLVHGSSAGMESIAELGPKWMAVGLKDFANPAQWAANKDFVFERSGEMRNRMNEVDRDVREHLREIDIRLMDTTSGAAARGADLMKARAYQGIAMLDMASALPTWMGAYHKAMAPESQGGLGMGEADAVYFADKTVRNAHGGTGAKDLAAVQRSGEMWKLFTMFYTFWNHNVNRLMDTARLAQSLPETYRTGEPGEFRGDLGLVIMRTLIYTLGVQAMHSMLHPKKDAEGDTNWLAWAAKEFTAAAFAGIPILRDVAAHYLTGKDYAATPAAGIVQAVGNTGQDVMNAMLGKETSPKALKHTITTAGYVFGLPTGQAASTAQFLWDVAQGYQTPEDAGDWLRGLMHGDMHTH